VGGLDLDDAFANIIDEVSKEVPTHEGQVVLVVFDEYGVY